MHPDLEAILTTVDSDLDRLAEPVADFLRTEDNPADTYAALALALGIMNPSDVLDIAFAGVIHRAKDKLAADAPADAPADADV
jgi:hypothetical protein